MPFNLSSLLRQNIRELKPYSSARSEFTGKADVYLDANENAYGSPLAAHLPPGVSDYNRYPDPLQKSLKEALSRIKGVPPAQMLLGNGSDECIDLLIRAFCHPRHDNMIILPPTYGMYKVYADINDVEVREAPLNTTFQPDLDRMAESVDERTKIIFFCTPNNPTGNAIDREAIEAVLMNFDGIVVVDEAYINYSAQRSWISALAQYPNLVVMQTLSKAWGLAALRVGVVFASVEIIEVLNKIKPPYNIGAATQDLAFDALKRLDGVNKTIQTTVAQRSELATQLAKISFVKNVFPSDANFLLVKVEDADGLYSFLRERGIIIRNRNGQTGCEGCVRITVGTPEENNALLQAMSEYGS